LASMGETGGMTGKSIALIVLESLVWPLQQKNLTSTASRCG